MTCKIDIEASATGKWKRRKRTEYQMAPHEIRAEGTQI